MIEVHSDEAYKQSAIFPTRRKTNEIDLALIAEQQKRLAAEAASLFLVRRLLAAIYDFYFSESRRLVLRSASRAAAHSEGHRSIAVAFVVVNNGCFD